MKDLFSEEELLFPTSESQEKGKMLDNEKVPKKEALTNEQVNAQVNEQMNEFLKDLEAETLFDKEALSEKCDEKAQDSLNNSGAPHSKQEINVEKHEFEEKDKTNVLIETNETKAALAKEDEGARACLEQETTDCKDEKRKNMSEKYTYDANNEQSEKVDVIEDALEKLFDSEMNMVPTNEENKDEKETSGQEEGMEKNKEQELYEVLALRNRVLFPGVMMPVQVGREKSLKLVEKARAKNLKIAVCCQKEASVNDPGINDMYTLGALARIEQVLEVQNGVKIVVLEGLERIEVDEYKSTRNGLKALVHTKKEQLPRKNDKEFLAIVSNIKEQALDLIDKSRDIPHEASITVKNIDNPPTLVNYIASNIGLKIEEIQQLLAYDVLTERAHHLLEMLNKQVQMQQIKEEVKSKTEEELTKQQRDFFLHQQMQTIQKELGDTGVARAQEMRNKAESKKWSEATKQAFEKELRKLERISTQSPEYTTQENYLETILELPWGEYSEDNYDLKHAQEVLDADHYGMEKVKERIIEYLAVQKQLAAQPKSEANSPILCLYGPPGVGKTSLGKSIADALGRKYARISLGGLHDEAEIRGHRRTYIGAMPGRIVQSLRKVGTSNPVFILDEIDKMGQNAHGGDPTAALLEVLDPEQNSTFHDNFLDIQYDLSRVLFIATANSLDSIPRPLLDRMELIEMTGYLQEEKEEIAKRHLIPNELKKHGIKPSQLKFKKEIISHIIDDYTRESGVRSLDRQIATICRKVDTSLALEKEYNTTITKEDLISYLGQPRYSRDSWETNKYLGIVTGLAWTQVGGEILFIEVSLSPSKTPTLTLTGNLGDVMKESATLALGYIKAHSEQFGIKQEDLETQSVHIHVPEGAIPKDGPSAGITMTTALVSAFAKRLVKPRIAMTGEMTLRGKVLPIGGVKEKLLAAKRAGITDIVLCKDNKKDVAEIPEQYLKGLTFHYVEDIQEVIDVALL